MRKDSITGEEVIDYGFLGKKLYPPKKLGMLNTWLNQSLENQQKQ